MSKALEELLFKIRQDPAFKELLAAVDAPAGGDFKPSGDALAQLTNHIFRSGQKRQHDNWRTVLTGEPTSEQEKS